MTAAALIAIAVGILVPSLQHKHGREALTAFDEVGPGRIEGNLCINDFFGFCIEVPRGWHVDTRETLRQVVQERSEGDRANMAIILAAWKGQGPAPGEFNMALSLLVAAVRLSSLPDVKTVDDFMRRTIKVREKMKLHYGKHGEPYKCVIGGRVFHRMECLERFPNGMATVSMLALFRRGYAISIGATWQSEQDGRVLAEALNSIRFK